MTNGDSGRGNPWTRIEVEATVSSYFEMLELELRGERYNKTAHRRALLPLLNQRSEGAIEFKHQNITAVLIEIGFAWITGYKPSVNYQTLLRDVVVDRLADRHDLRALVEQVVEDPEPVRVPSVDDFLRVMTDPPWRELRTGSSGEIHRGPPRPTYGVNVNYLEREARNQALGLAGEQFVLNFETARLEYAGKGALAQRIVHTASEVGDQAGFDISSFEEDGRERHIEVKTTTFGAHTPFYLSRNQVNVSRGDGDRYHLYRVFRFREDPRLFTLQGPLDQVCELDPVEFLGRVAFT